MSKEKLKNYCNNTIKFFLKDENWKQYLKCAPYPNRVISNPEAEVAGSYDYSIYLFVGKIRALLIRKKK